MGQKGGRDAFVSQGFDTWNKKDAFRTHVGGVDSFHSKSREKCEFLMREKQAINVVLRRQTEADDHKYKVRLRVSIIVARLLLKTVLLSIREEIDQDVFALLVDESSDVSKKEQMDIVLRYVNSLGFVKERFIGVVHVKDTSSLTLKNAINEVLTSNKLSFSQIRGQCYDGANNMSGEFDGLKALILQENDMAFYVHCFAHQLQLVVVAVAKKHDGVSDFFEQILLVVNVVCASYMIDLEGQLEIFYHSCIKDDRFTSLKGISNLSRLMVSTGKHRYYPLVYKLLKLSLILPVVTASVERCFSKMKLLKINLCNNIGDEFLNDALLCNVETEALVKVENEKVMERIQKMSARRGQI
ncbi:uncharacterized protein LOC111894713 [Lactuca sativa]|uniref:uncharacterized protein LOC111894713 n=1 Tax=Lactuca sativa TaxID=4236 RepID=UPI000CD91264|nr:uncharacterized protein LOC111894713 [Lactuca sativa]